MIFIPTSFLHTSSSVPLHVDLMFVLLFVDRQMAFLSVYLSEIGTLLMGLISNQKNFYLRLHVLVVHQEFIGANEYLKLSADFQSEPLL
jgi:hypothetical protein